MFRGAARTLLAGAAIALAVDGAVAQDSLLGLPLIHFIRAGNYVGTSGEHVDMFCHLFFDMADKSCLAFFDPNGARMELTTETASPQLMATYRSEARGLCNAWTAEKRNSKKPAAATAEVA